MLGDLKTDPVLPGLLSDWWSSPSRIIWQLPPSFKHCLWITVITVASYSRRFFGIAAISDLSHHSFRNYFFILSDSSSHSQPCVNVYGRASPEASTIKLFGMATFSPGPVTITTWFSS